MTDIFANWRADAPKPHPEKPVIKDVVDAVICPWCKELNGVPEDYSDDEYGRADGSWSTCRKCGGEFGIEFTWTAKVTTIATKLGEKPRVCKLPILPSI